MTWNPSTGIGMFEPGCITCAECGWKPEDPWDDSPGGFSFIERTWTCHECTLPPFIVASNPNDSEHAGVRE